MELDAYQKLLQRARKDLPTPASDGERFHVPPAEVIYEGKTTIVRNFGEILDKINRASDHTVPILLREMGTAGNYDGGRLILQARVSETVIGERIQKYVDTYVTCGECGRPDTHLVKEERTTVVKCDACGGHRPVKAPKKAAQQKPAEAVEEGKTYEVMIEDTGKRGDGIARRDKYVIFIEGAQKGQVYQVKVTRVTGTLAFAEIVKPSGTPAPQK